MQCVILRAPAAKNQNFFYFGILYIAYHLLPVHPLIILSHAGTTFLLYASPPVLG